MVLKNVIKSDITKEGVKQILSHVDDLILKKKTIKDPAKLLKKKKEVIIDDKKIPVGPGGEKTTIKVKDFKAKQPTVPKETIDDFLQSFQSKTIPNCPGYIESIWRNDSGKK